MTSSCRFSSSLGECFFTRQPFEQFIKRDYSLETTYLQRWEMYQQKDNDLNSRIYFFKIVKPFSGRKISRKIFFQRGGAVLFPLNIFYFLHRGIQRKLEQLEQFLADTISSPQEKVFTSIHPITFQHWEQYAFFFGECIHVCHYFWYFFGHAKSS